MLGGRIEDDLLSLGESNLMGGLTVVRAGVSNDNALLHLFIQTRCGTDWVELCECGMWWWTCGCEGGKTVMGDGNSPTKHVIDPQGTDTLLSH